MRAMHERMQTLLYVHGVCFQDTEAPVFGSVDLQGLANYFKAKYPDGQYDAKSRGKAIENELWIEAVKGIAIHEVGHSLGLLHNFASSYDSANYHPQYWQLRTHDGASTASCNGEPRTGDTFSAASDSCMGPRYLDPETDDEQGFGAESRPGIMYFGQTSVMEYPLERFGESSGLGQYDAHAMKALYGRVLETIDDEAHGGFTVKESLKFAPRLETQLTEQDRVVRKTRAVRGAGVAKPTHYTELARLMKVFDPRALPRRDRRGEGAGGLASRPRQGLRAAVQGPRRVARLRARAHGSAVADLPRALDAHQGRDRRPARGRCAGCTATEPSAPTSTPLRRTPGRTRTRSRKRRSSASRATTRGPTSGARTASTTTSRSRSA